MKTQTLEKIMPGGEQRKLLKESHERLRSKNLLGPHCVVLSLRIPGESAFAVLRSGSNRAGTLTTDVPQDVHRLHAAIYELRPDVGAVVYNRPVWGGALALLDEPMPGIFDEQARQMGARVEHLQTSPSGEPTPESRKRLLRGANVFLHGHWTICLGMTRERAVFNCELLEKCAKAYVLARATGEGIRRIPWFVRFIAGRRLLKDEKRSAKAYARGEVPGGFTAY